MYKESILGHFSYFCIKSEIITTGLVYEADWLNCCAICIVWNWHVIGINVRIKNRHLFAICFGAQKYNCKCCYQKYSFHFLRFRYIIKLFSPICFMNLGQSFAEINRQPVETAILRLGQSQAVPSLLVE